ncbi:myc protein [Chrysoperla carnea]|uniref:myc protein n=1 Tax=Chrysoperla carnea TaxID=189513 RepID=UPI001D072E76|nr:myc protein [Chrysoperla carnea]
MLVVNSETTSDMDFMLLTSYGHNLVSLVGDEVFEDQQPNTQDIWEKFEVLDNCPMNEFFPLSPLLPSLKTDYHDPILDMIDKGFPENKLSRPSEIRNHDCMWAGHCASKDHETPQQSKYKKQSTCQQNSTSSQQSNQNTNRRCSSNINQQTTSGRSLLINSKNNQQIKNNIRHDHSFSKVPKAVINGNVQHYETPEVSSEDDSMDCNPQLQQIVDYITSEKQTVMQILNEALSNTEADLCDYLHDNLELENSGKKQTNGGDNEEDDSSASSVSSGSESSESESEECDNNEYSQTIQTPPASMKKKNVVKNDNVMVTSIMPDHAYHRSAESDHCYHISKESSKRFENLGVDTPSDSEEEEIDVVNVYGSETHHQMLRQYHQKAPLPTNPSLYDRQTLQRSVATAINKRRRTIKTRLPNHNNRTGTTTPTTVPTSQTEYMQQSGSQQSVTTNHSSGTNCSSYSSRNIKDQHSPNITISPPPTPQSSPPQRVNKKRGATDNLQKSSTQSTSKGVKRARRSYRQRRKRGSGDSSDSDSDKRSLHNDMERQRRVDLRNAFDDLRVLLPSVCNKERAAKVNILRDAAEYCHEVSRLEDNLQQTKLELKRHQDGLKARVSYLRRLLASKR